MIYDFLLQRNRHNSNCIPDLANLSILNTSRDLIAAKDMRYSEDFSAAKSGTFGNVTWFFN